MYMYGIYAKAIGITEKAAEKMIDKIVKLKDRYITMCQASYLPNNMKTDLENLIIQRTAVLIK